MSWWRCPSKSRGVESLPCWLVNNGFDHLTNSTHRQNQGRADEGGDSRTDQLERWRSWLLGRWRRYLCRQGSSTRPLTEEDARRWEGRRWPDERASMSRWNSAAGRWWRITLVLLAHCNSDKEQGPTWTAENKKVQRLQGLISKPKEWGAVKICW